MRYTAILNDGRHNFQLNYSGTKGIEYFSEYCIRANIVWARLFNEDNGDAVAKYVNHCGLIML